MSPGSNTESYPAFAHIGLRKTPEKTSTSYLAKSLHHIGILESPEFMLATLWIPSLCLLVQLCQELLQWRDTVGGKRKAEPPLKRLSLGYGTSFDGEITAISESLRNLLCQINKFKNAVILSDSKAAILSIVSKHTPSSQIAEINKMLSQLITLNKRIVFQWIPSHCGILGNENADALAKKGSTATYRPVTKSTYFSVKRFIKPTYLDFNKQNLIAQSQGKKWNSLHHNPQLIPDLPRKSSVAAFRLATGHDCLAKHLHRIGIYQSPNCPLCNSNQEMDSEHLNICASVANHDNTFEKYWSARGDVHGNYQDLTAFEKVLLHLGASVTPATILYLGDYVDRGQYGVEVVARLFALKAKNPNQFFLLRGNHEIRLVQIQFTFRTECINKFGEVLGNRVWEAVNEVFDHMPFAAVIDRKVFCCHGGIPPPWLCPLVNVINSIPCPLNTPDEQSALAWELMWNDPISDGKIPEPLRMELIANEGFATNTRRGTAHVWNTEALEHFLMVNNLSHVIRAHEMQQTGFQLGDAHVQAIRKIQQALGDDVMSITQIKERYNCFKYGRISVESEPHSGSPSKNQNDNVID
ncbi:hypothetical protein ANN_06983 [Periplaneta americana]|uniref:Serine/threonine-protein phosphatase n=1 Tax=Periplaneta americana TaxID=6978 RepID=A0ABQ8TFS5_PERAM|nr:hypothetical protein ANN_06983 [Periplaneta americana]